MREDRPAGNGYPSHEGAASPALALFADSIAASCGIGAGGLHFSLPVFEYESRIVGRLSAPTRFRELLAVEEEAL
jgi:hypothetical protein